MTKTENAEDNWTTYNGHPSSRLEYQETFGVDGTVARVIEKGQEVVSPSRDLNAVYRQYMSRVQNYTD